MYQIVLAALDVPAQPLDVDGVSIRVLAGDPQCGPSTILTEMQPGSVIPRDWHREADETVFVIDGDFIEGGVAHGPGAFFSGRARTSHGPHETRSGCKVLTQFSAALDFQPGTFDEHS